MLTMTKQIDHLKILYKQILATSIEIKKLIERDNYDEALSREAHKTQLIEKVNFVKNSFKMTDFESSTLKKIIEDIQKQENENLAKLKELKADVALKLKSLNAKNKIANKYAGNIEPQEGSILDFSE